MKHFAALAIALSISLGASAASFNDCILDGLKGVSSNVAAWMIKKACEEKQEADRLSRLASLAREYGDTLAEGSVELSEDYELENPGIGMFAVTNRTSAPRRSVTYLRLIVAPIEEGGHICSWHHARSYAYSLKLKPAATKLVRVLIDSKHVCARVKEVRGREPSLFDISLASPEIPMPRDPFSDPSLRPAP